MTDAVRYATLADVPRIVELARLEHHLSQWGDTDFDAEAAAEVASHFINSMGHTLLVTEKGYLAGLLQPVGFNRKLIALEYAWFAKDGQGLAMLHRFHDWAVQMGAIAVVAHDYMHSGHLSAVLNKRYGYGQLGTAMVFRIDQRMADLAALDPQPEPEPEGAEA